MDGKSLSVTEDKINRLKEILPEAFTENKINREKLKAALGDNIEFKSERYVLNWVAKPQKVFTLDRLFKNNDKLKTNTALQMKDAGIEFKAI